MVVLFPECFFYFPSEEFSRILFVYLSDMVIFPDFVWLWLMDWCVVSLLRQYEQSVWMHSCHLGYDWWIGSILDLRGILPWKCLPIVFLVLYVSFESLCLKFKDDIIWDSLFFIMHSIIYIIFIRCEKYVNLWFMKDEKWNTGLQRCFGALSNLHFRIKKKIFMSHCLRKFLKNFFFGGTITLWGISRDILRGLRLFWPLKLSRLYRFHSSMVECPHSIRGARVRFLDDAVQYLAFGEKYWDVMYTLRPCTSSQPSSTGT